jgi:glutamine amidotransferase
VSSRLRAGAGPADALAQAIGALAEHQVSGRFNFLLSNGEVIAATAAGDTLCYRLSGESVLVASEPGDDEPGWTQVSDQCVLTASPRGVQVRPLPVPGLECMLPATEGMTTR